MTGSDFNELFVDIVRHVSQDPDFVCKPRGQLVKEKLAVTFRLDDPRNRLIVNRARDANYGFAVGEFLWYWSGKRDLETMLYYNKRMKDFSEDGRTLNSAYGHRLRAKPIFVRESAGSGQVQWETTKRTLAADPDSRRAIMLINVPEDEREGLMPGSPDVPCTLALQFFVRDGRLHLHVTMRSNDVMWGLSYDAFSFSLFQECMMLDLRETYPDKFGELELGTYIHTAGSMHLYSRHFDQADKIVSEARNFVPVRPMEPISSLADLHALCEDADHLRLKQVKMIDETSYEGSLRWMAVQLNAHALRRFTGVRND